MTGNALVTAVIAAVVSGVISFGIAHWQSRDAAKQAAASQQVQQVIQLESAAGSFRQAAERLYDSDQKCTLKYTSSCKQLVITTMNDPLLGPGLLT